MISNNLRGGFSRQSGAALTVVMILLLVMTLLGLASTRSSLLQERMSGAMYDRSVAFQAAEAGLRQAEDFVEANTPDPVGSGCTNGLCGFLDPTAPPAWAVATNWNTAPTVDVGGGFGAEGQSQYLIELLADQVPRSAADCSTGIDISTLTCGGDARRYRITARSGGAGRAAVMIQSILATGR